MLRRSRHGVLRLIALTPCTSSVCLRHHVDAGGAAISAEAPPAGVKAARRRGGAIPPGTLIKPKPRKSKAPRSPPDVATPSVSPLEAYFSAMEASDDVPKTATVPSAEQPNGMEQQRDATANDDDNNSLRRRGVLVEANDGRIAVAPQSDPARSYPTINDPQERFHVSDPRADGMMLDLMGGADDDMNLTPAPLSLAARYRQAGAEVLWAACAHHGARTSGPPEWFETVCKHLYFRTAEESTTAAVTSTTSVSEAAATPAAAPEEGAVDPFLWIDFNLFDQDKYIVGPYAFQSTAAWFTDEIRSKLCLGDVDREYVCFAEGYCFPDRRQLPTSLGTAPMRLWFDPSQSTPTVLIQLSPEMPPAMWLPVKPSAAAIRRVVSEFAATAALHRDGHHAVWEQRWDRAKRTLALQRMPTTDADVLRMVGHAARDVTYGEAPVREFPNSQEFFLGEYDDPERLLDYFDLCPFLFAVPLMRTVADVHAKEFVPRIDGPGLATSLYRCVFSKALLFVQVHLSVEVKLPPQDPEAFQYLWRDSEQLPKSKIPVFVRIVWPDNQRMCGGGRVVERFNAMFGTEFCRDIPVDACMAVWSMMAWAKQQHELLGVLGMRARLAAIEAAAASSSSTPLLYPGTREIPNPEYTDDERLGMHIQYLAHLRDPQARDTLLRLWRNGAAPVRMGCAKAALELGDRALFREIVSSEPPGRMQTYMVKLVRKRKARDLTDAVPRLMDDQFEFSAPLWTKRMGNPKSLGAGGAAKK